MKMEAARSFETLVFHYQNIRRRILVDSNIQVFV
jgi:hypothetical protein